MGKAGQKRRTDTPDQRRSKHTKNDARQRKQKNTHDHDHADDHDMVAGARDTHVEENEEEEEEEEGLFDNLDAAPAPDLLDKALQELEGASSVDSQSEDEDEDEENYDEEEAEEEEDEHDSGEADDDGDDDEEEEREQGEKAQEATKPKSSSNPFRDDYMEKMTVAFGSDLDTIRQEPALDTGKLGMLIDSLEAGIDIFSDLEKEVILANKAS